MTSVLVSDESMQAIDALRKHLSPSVWTLLERSGAALTPHSGRTLLEHLAGTWQLLRDWGNPEAVCLGGLFHSIYGTNAFLRESLSSQRREELQAAIGREAEQLAWLFSSVDRPRAVLEGLKSPPGGGRMTQPLALSARVDRRTLGSLIVTREQLFTLAEIECANLMEQKTADEALRNLYCAGIDRPVLSLNAMKALRAWLGQRLREGSSHSTNSGVAV
jgi:hypothetical protein